MKSKKKISNDAVADIIGTVLMLGMAVSLIAMVYISVLSYPFTPSPISADLIGSVDGNNIIIEHHGGDSLSLSTEIAVTVGGTTTRITVEDYLDDESKADGLWNIGERVVYSDETLTDLQVKVAVVDTKSNSAILMGILQEGETVEVPSLVTSVDAISPYTQTSSPFTVNATGDSGLDNVTLYYRWSDDNVSWSGGGISGETNDTVDSNTTDIDSSSDKGTETNFANAQDTSPDSDFMNIQENFTGASAVDEWLENDGDATTLSDATHHGSPIYLATVDTDNYLTIDKGRGSAQWYTFDDTVGGTGTYTVNISVYFIYGDGNDDLIWGVDTNGDDTPDYSGTILNPTSGWYTDSVGSLTQAEVNAARARVEGVASAGYNDPDIDAIRLGAYKAGTTNYEIDFEYNWSDADFDEDNEEVCFYVGGSFPSENLNVSYWDGSWNYLGQITSTGWTNLTATDLSDSTYEIQLKGDDESSDSSQDDWDIDVISLHTWNSTQGVNWGIWSDASNPDASSPWSWNFDFPNGSGYYEFYSIGRYNGDVEAAPGSADAICKYEE